MAKLVAMIMLTAGSCRHWRAPATCSGTTQLRADLERRPLAGVWRSNSEAALLFGDPRVAGEVLSTLAAAPRLRMACLYDGHERLFAAWHRAGSADKCPATVGADALVYGAATLELIASGYDGKKYGTVFLQSATTILTTRLRMQGLVTAVVLGVALAMALLVSSRLHTLVSDPVLELARTAGEVTARGDYSMRAKKITTTSSARSSTRSTACCSRSRSATVREANRPG